jgi:hypothetical protein
MDLSRDFRPMLNPVLLSTEFPDDERGCAMDLAGRLIDLVCLLVLFGLALLLLVSVRQGWPQQKVLACVCSLGGVSLLLVLLLAWADLRRGLASALVLLSACCAVIGSHALLRSGQRR